MSAAAAAAPAGSLLAAGAARARIPGDCGSPGHDPRRRAGALSSRRQAIEGAFAVNDDAMLHDARLREVALRLGAGAAERLDVERTARVVVERLRAEPRAERWTWLQPAWLRIAAAAILVIGGGLVTRALVWQRAPGSAVVVPVGEDLTDLTAEQLREALTALDQPVSMQGAGDLGVEGLTAEELRALLQEG